MNVRHVPWFEEPTLIDDSWARRGEESFSWLARSTLPRAAAARAFLNRNLLSLPAEDQPRSFAALRSRWNSAFFELIVARTLQMLGASITIEPDSKEGPKIDFVAAFPSGIVNVEAIAPRAMRRSLERALRPPSCVSSGAVLRA